MINEPNPYAPPTTVEDFRTSPQAMTETDAEPYYVVPTAKMVLLSLASFGFFQLYWLYKQWKVVARRTEQNLSPFWRTFFSIWFINRLFVQVRSDSASVDVPAGMSTGALSAIYIITSLIGNGASRAGAGPLWMISLFSIVPLVLVQQEINQYQARVSPDLDRNTRWSAGNIILVVFGAIFWVLVIIGTVAPEK